jgi:hypothetical protein
MANTYQQGKLDKKKVRKIITKRVKAMVEAIPEKRNLPAYSPQKVHFVTLGHKGIDHEKQVAAVGAHVISINKFPERIAAIQKQLDAEGVSNVKTEESDILKYAIGYDKKRTFMWFDFCDFINSWLRFFNCIGTTSFCKNSQVAVTFSCTPRNYGNSDQYDEFFPNLKNKLAKSEDRPLTLAQRVFRDCSERMTSLGWRCCQALCYTSNGGKMTTLIFDRQKGRGVSTLKNLTPEPSKKSKNQKREVDMTSLVKVMRVARDENLSSADLRWAFRSPQSIAHITMAEKKGQELPLTWSDVSKSCDATP